MSALEDRFPGIEVIYLGGVIYNCALAGVIGNFTPEDDTILELALQLDEQYSRQGLNEYAVAFSRVESAGAP